MGRGGEEGVGRGWMRSLSESGVVHMHMVRVGEGDGVWVRYVLPNDLHTNSIASPTPLQTLYKP